VDGPDFACGDSRRMTEQSEDEDRGIMEFRKGVSTQGSRSGRRFVTILDSTTIAVEEISWQSEW